MINGGLMTGSGSTTNIGGLISPQSSQTITLSPGAVGSSGQWNSPNINISLSEVDWGIDSHVKKYQVFEIDEDLLALSCTWQRLRSPEYKETHDSYVPVSKLTDNTLFKHIKQEDRDKAAQVRDYYSKKIMLWKLKGENLSRFREDMNSFIHTDGKIFREEMMPLAYRLPEFYDYDSDFDILSNEYNKKVTQSSDTITCVKRLKLAKTFVVGKRHSKRKEYWFGDENNDLVAMYLSLDNPLISLLDLYAQNPIQVSAMYFKKYRDNNEYLMANKFKFV